jgi:PHD/YefM family antitoxin component YafN of YafNO toxin-antitoxin module
MRVSTADFIKHYGALADKALAEPVTITKNGRDRLVVVSAEEYQRLKQREGRALYAWELSENDIATLEAPLTNTDGAEFDHEYHP